MTEVEWLASADPERMLSRLGLGASARRLRLFAVACCRRREWDIAKQEFRDAVAVAERYADGLATADELRVASAAAAVRPARRTSATKARAQGYVYWVTQPDEHVPTAAGVVLSRKPAPKVWQSDLLRCVFGNPFRPVTFNPSWLSDTVTTLAAALYADRTFDRMPVLADALEEAGCDNSNVLEHCRGDGPHARGCWVVDGVLGKG